MQSRYLRSLAVVAAMWGSPSVEAATVSVTEVNWWDLQTSAVGVELATVTGIDGIDRVGVRLQSNQTNGSLQGNVSLATGGDWVFHVVAREHEETVIDTINSITFNIDGNPQPPGVLKRTNLQNRFGNETSLEVTVPVDPLSRTAPFDFQFSSTADRAGVHQLLLFGSASLVPIAANAAPAGVVPLPAGAWLLLSALVPLLASGLRRRAQAARSAPAA